MNDESDSVSVVSSHVKMSNDDDVKGLSSSSFLLRHAGGDQVSYNPMTSDEMKVYRSKGGIISKTNSNENKIKLFNNDGSSRIKDAISESGGGKITVQNTGEHEIYEIPKDDNDARESRLEEFVTKAESLLKSHEGFDDIKSFLAPNEEIVCELECSDLQGSLPNHTDESHISGAIKCALINNPKKGNKSRLIFSVAEGSTKMSLKEEFVEMLKETSCICCCIKVRRPSGEVIKSELSSKVGIDYEHVKSFTGQFFSLPVQTSIIDSVANKLSTEEFQAKFGELTSPPLCDDNCCKQLECICLCCQKCPDCEIPPCCGYLASLGKKTVSFTLQDTHHISYEEESSNLLSNVPVAEKSIINFEINQNNDYCVNITIHYVNQLDLLTKTFNMRLKCSGQPQTDYALAQKFVSLLNDNCNHQLVMDRRTSLSHMPLAIAEPLNRDDIDENTGSKPGLMGAGLVAGGLAATFVAFSKNCTSCLGSKFSQQCAMCTQRTCISCGKCCGRMCLRSIKNNTPCGSILCSCID